MVKPLKYPHAFFVRLDDLNYKKLHALATSTNTAPAVLLRQFAEKQLKKVKVDSNAPIS